MPYATPVRSLLRQIVILAGAIGTTLLTINSAHSEQMALILQYQVETKTETGRFHRLERTESWEPTETAVIVCDVWDFHHCLNAVRRVQQLAPRLNRLVDDARRRGVTIIHAPSDCMATYEQHPARLRAIQTPAAPALPPEITAWCSKIPAEERAVYPVDQSDGGEDDDPLEHAEWAAQLAAMGRNPRAPWKSQTSLITINEHHDYVSDKGDEIWNILHQRGIKNVILTGVHTNMCVLGRPFGLRQMARNGKNVVLMRDLTDTMYNPQRWPYVSHYTGTDLIIDHIERFVCPTMTSDQLLGGEPLRFQEDRRPHVAMLIAEDEYQTEQTLPQFALEHLGKDFRVSLIYGSETNRHEIPGISQLNRADLLLISVRRRGLPPADLATIRNFVASGKPVIGIRTASHAFSLADPLPAGVATWPELDAVVFGGNYHGHLGNELASTISFEPTASQHPLLQGLEPMDFPQGGSLYRTSPLAVGATKLLVGRAAGHPDEPVAWTFTRQDGGRSFYTSLGSPKDFERPEFVTLLKNAIYWSSCLPVPRTDSARSTTAKAADHWSLVTIPESSVPAQTVQPGRTMPLRWYRSVVRIPRGWLANSQPLTITVPVARGVQVRAWLNGSECRDVTSTQDATARSLVANSEFVVSDDANLLVIRLSGDLTQARLIEAPEIASDVADPIILAGRWQARVGDDPSWSNIPLPAKFGGSSDIVFEPATTSPTAAK